MTEVILGVLLSLAVHVTDRDEPIGDRTDRLRRVAVAIDSASLELTCEGIHKLSSCRRVWGGSRQQIVAAIIAIGKHESWFSGYVQAGQCQLGPRGSRCDPRSGTPMARGPWQIWRVTDPELWTLPAGSPDALRRGALRTGQLWAGGYGRCYRRGRNALLGAFSAHAGTGSCARPSARVRAGTYRWVLSALERARIRPQDAPAAPADRVAVQDGADAP